MSRKPANRKLVRALLCLVLGSASPGVGAEVIKCRDASGKVHYGDRPCRPGREQIYRPPRLTTIEATRLTGGRSVAAVPPAPKTVFGIPVPDPVRDCRARGGEIDRDLRACRLPIE